VLDLWEVREATPRAVLSHLEAGARGEREETLKPGDPALAGVRAAIVGSNAMALEAIAAGARTLGFQVLVDRAPLVGEARRTGQELGTMARRMRAELAAPRCVVRGGETTVTVRGTGVGGRNQELVLAAAIAMEGTPSVAVASLATDGVDGPTDAAGAIATGETCAAARSLGIDAAAALENNDSRTFFGRIGGLIRTGPTGTNVNDVTVVLAYPAAG
jgi:glycerate 2-kinase